MKRVKNYFCNARGKIFGDKMSENTPQDDIQAQDQQPMIFITLLQSILTTLALSFVGALMREFTFWTGYISNMVQNSWSGLVQATNLSFEAIRFRTIEIIAVLFYGGASISMLFKDLFRLIFAIFQGAIQSIADMVRSPIRIASEADLMNEVHKFTTNSDPTPSPFVDDMPLD